jgi:hypothetical protein
MSDKLNDIFIWVQLDQRGYETGVQTVNIAFDPDPTRVHYAEYTDEYSRKEVAQMLRALATRVEFNITGEPH